MSVEYAIFAKDVVEKHATKYILLCIESPTSIVICVKYP